MTTAHFLTKIRRARLLTLVAIGLTLLVLAAFAAILVVPTLVITALGVGAVAHGSRSLHRMEGS